jgi:hypothetical protein
LPTLREWPPMTMIDILQIDEGDAAGRVSTLNSCRFSLLC